MRQSRELPGASSVEGSIESGERSRGSHTNGNDSEVLPSGASVSRIDAEGLSSAELTELLQADQLRRWRAGESPPAESYIDRWPVLAGSDDALDLVYAEVLLRRERGESPSLAEYQHRFPRFAEALTLHFELEPWVAEAPVSRSRLNTRTDAKPGVAMSPQPRQAGPFVPGYEIEAELGRGGMGVVYKARQVRLNRVCALKMILAGAHADPEAFLRFLGEAESVARLNHPNIIQIYHTGEVDGLPFLELEFVDGESLAARLNGTPWAPRRAAALVEALAQAMAEAHRQGVVHRDLKPANILLTGDGVPKITDFGLAKALGSDSGLTRTNSVIGSPTYMAPEQAEGHARDAGPTTDIYSLGAILYELLTGRPPFKAASVAETMEQVRTLDPVPPARLVPGLPRDIETICLTCLQKEPARRFASAMALRDDLERFLSGQVIHSRRSTQLERGWRWARRNRTVATLLAVLFLTMASGFGATVLLWRRAEGEARRATRLASSETGLRGAAQLQAASLALDRGLALADDGDPDRALHWFARAAQTAPSTELGLIRIARANLASFGAQMPFLKAIHDAQGPDHALWIGPDARTVVEFGPGDFARLKDVIRRSDLGQLPPHSGPINAVAFSPDGTLLATGSRDRRIQIWHIPDGRLVAAWLAPESPDTLSFHPSGRTLATAGSRESAAGAGRGERHLRLWNVPEGHEVSPPAVEFGLPAMAGVFSPDGKTLAVASPPDATKLGGVVLWDLATGQPRRLPIGDTHGFHTIRFSTDGKTVLLLSVNKGLVCNVGTGQPCLTDPIQPPTLPEVNTQDQALFTSGFLTPDGATIAVGDSLGYVQFRDAKTGRRHGPIVRHGSSVDDMAVSPDGQTALIVGGFTARLYDIPTGQPLGGKMGLFHNPTATKTNHRALTFDAKGQTAAIVSGSTVAVWDITMVRSSARVIPHRIGPGPLAFSPDGTRLLTGSLLEPTARLWDPATGEPVGPVLVHDSPRSGGGTTRIHVVAFSPDGRVAITAGEDRYVRFWDPRTGHATSRPLLQPHWVVSARFSPDGKKLLVGTAAGTAALWDFSGDTTTHKIIKGRGPEAQELAFSPDGKTALIRSHGTEPLLVDTSTGNVIQLLQEPVACSGFAFLAGGRSVISRAGGSLRRFDPRNGSTQGSLFGDLINALAIGPDGRSALTGGEDGSLRIWDAATGVALGSAMAHRSPIRAVAFSPDGLMVASGDQEGTIRFWNLATRRQVGPPVSLGVQASQLAFSPDGRLLAANGSLVRLCDVPDLDRVASGPTDIWAQVRTGHRLDEIGGVIPLESATWNRLRREVDSPTEAPAIFTTSSDQGKIEDLDWHERHASDSERQRLWSSALWHLDRMITIRPGAAWLHARRLRVLQMSGRDANAEEKQFRSLASPAELVAWDSEEAFRHEASANWPAALRSFDRLVAAMPADDWLRHRRARVLARLGRWPEAASELARCIKPEFTLPFLYRERILAQLRAGDLQGFRASCAELVARIDSTPPPFVAYLAALACVAGPGAIPDPDLPIRLAQIGGNGFRDEARAGALFALGAAYHRAGRFDEAAQSLTESVKRGDDTPRAWAYVAMAHLGARHEAEARPWLDRLRQRARGNESTDFWDEVEIDVLTHELATVPTRSKGPGAALLPGDVFAPAFSRGVSIDGPMGSP